MTSCLQVFLYSQYGKDMLFLIRIMVYIAEKVRVYQEHLHNIFSFSNTGYEQPTIDDDNNSRPLMTLVYFSDQQQNFRIFNNYFPVVKNGNSVTDTISYKSTYTNKKPSTIGMALVSVLANIYVYNGEDERLMILHILLIAYF